MNIRQGKTIHKNRPMTIILKIKSLCCALLTKSKRQARDDITLSQQLQGISKYTAFGMWWHTVTQGWGSEGETGEWSG